MITRPFFGLSDRSKGNHRSDCRIDNFMKTKVGSRDAFVHVIPSVAMFTKEAMADELGGGESQTVAGTIENFSYLEVRERGESALQTEGNLGARSRRAGRRERRVVRLYVIALPKFL